MEVLRVKGQVS